MIRLLLFFKKIYVALLFIGLEIVCFSIFLENNPYQRAQSIAISSHIVGGLHEKISGVGNYFQLASQNDALMLENAKLRSELLSYQLRDTVSGTHAGFLGDSLPVMVVNVVRNTITARDNFITISGGRKAGLQPDMALFNTEGIVGYVLYCSDNFAVAASVLNHSLFNTSGKILGSDFTGSISWNGENYQVVDFDEIPKYANIAIGDTIQTTSHSNRFPPNLPIGVVESFDLINGTFFKAKVRLSADLSRLNKLYAVKLKERDERAAIESKVNINQ